MNFSKKCLINKNKKSSKEFQTFFKTVAKFFKTHTGVNLFCASSASDIEQKLSALTNVLTLIKTFKHNPSKI